MIKTVRFTKETCFKGLLISPTYAIVFSDSIQKYI